MDFLEKIKDIIIKFTTREITLAIAESCTGGYISNMFTNISGASKVFERGIICYSNASKVALLNVDPESINQHGAVSETVAKQLAYNIRVLSNVDIGIGITGIAGPTGGTLEKPVGLAYIGISTTEKIFVEKHHFDVDRITFKAKILEKILLLLQNLIQ
ncbi:MAG: competence protein ComA [Promethearchaeota archaeon Loki_b31]|nr:MAG: competence protein ComA [Candidatus Lokiarchaeota archaeon Loki_b31]